MDFSEIIVLIILGSIALGGLYFILRLFYQLWKDFSSGFFSEKPDEIRKASYGALYIIVVILLYWASDCGAK
jgi:hypothetical protein